MEVSSQAGHELDAAASCAWCGAAATTRCADCRRPLCAREIIPKGRTYAGLCLQCSGIRCVAADDWGGDGLWLIYWFPDKPHYQPDVLRMLQRFKPQPN